MIGLAEHPMMAFHPRSTVVLLETNLNVTLLPVLEEMTSGKQCIAIHHIKIGEGEVDKAGRSRRISLRDGIAVGIICCRSGRIEEHARAGSHRSVAHGIRRQGWRCAADAGFPAGACRSA
ncbi:UNKNOWN [Stylonychia lemnae]|uniref:Uncharacterized protein n=1 Tax=Stylonychia lemnae TaxID=5949 RepID=A0A078AHU0_STYLE|nr:UNKNOWN [Stylonychia lemnae]|eukprot:CDW81456.1 UNKNOWN [Stylonychia lemnae]